jgi:hypothetical protein
LKLVISCWQDSPRATIWKFYPYTKTTSWFLNIKISFTPSLYEKSPTLGDQVKFFAFLC